MSNTVIPAGIVKSRGLTSIPFWAVHLACLLVFFTEFSWTAVAICFALFFVRMFGITGGYHRYFSHRSFKTGRTFQFVLAVLGTASAQKGVLWWAANHRIHHKFSDQEGDIHSPSRDGFWHSHVGWILSADNEETHYDKIPDLTKYPELRWLNEHFLVPPVALAVALYALGGMSWLVWGFFVSTTLLWHSTFTINSLSHVFGTRRYDTTDTSRNNIWLAFITLGEGWHNNHHCFMNSARQGFFWWEIDVTFYILKALSWVGVTWDLISPPERLLAPELAAAPIAATE